MRASFASVGDLLGYYRFVKLNLMSKQSPAGGMLRKLYGDIDDKRYGRVTQESLEAKHAFVSDVEGFVEWFHRNQRANVVVNREHLLAIFHLRFCPEASKYRGYNHMASCIRRENGIRYAKGQALHPKRLQYYQHICSLSRDMADETGDYFRAKGIIP